VISEIWLAIDQIFFLEVNVFALGIVAASFFDNKGKKDIAESPTLG